MTPAPRAVKLVTGAPDAEPGPPPLGLPAWSLEGDAVAVLFAGTSVTLAEASFLARQIPNAGALAPATLVILLGSSARAVASWRRLLGPRPVKIGRAPRCAALLALGYVDIGAAADKTTAADLVWGYAPA